jgi:TolB-like protein/Flp pilus assembly protein TadD
MPSFFIELRRRNVVRVGIVYVVVAWLLMQLASALEPALLLPDWVDRVVAVFLLIGFPIVLIFAWAFELTPDGLKLTSSVDRDESITPVTGKKLEHTIIVLLGLALVFFLVREVWSPGGVGSGDGDSALDSAGDSGVAKLLPASIAVLPFDDYSEGKDQDYFSKGIAEEILNLLAKTNALRVAARTSSFSFADSDMDIREIGQKLEVGTVLEGSVRKAGPTIRITAQLIDVESGYHVWSETYERDYTDIFKIQDEIAAAILASLKVHLLGEESLPEHAVAQRTIDMDAYNAFLIGNERMALRTQEDIEAARAKFLEAIKIDPEYVPAHVQLAHSWLLLEQDDFGGKDIKKEDVDAVVIPHLAKALELSPASSEAIAVNGYHHLQRFRYQEAADAFDRAITLNPNYALAYSWRAKTAYEQERFLDMLADKEKAYALDPMSLEISSDLAFEYRSFWRPKDAERVINRMFDLHPDHPLAFDAAIDNLEAHGRVGEALLMMDRALAANPDNEEFKNWRAWLLMTAGFMEEADAMGEDDVSFFIRLTDDRLDEAEVIVDKHLAEGDSRYWLALAREFYRALGATDSQEQINQLIDRSIALAERQNVPWRDQCNVYFVYDLRGSGHDDAFESTMTQCHKQFEERLKVNYLCPCTWYSLILYTAIDGRYDEAVQRADQWFTDGGSTSMLKWEPMFSLLSDHPKYEELLARNAEQVEHQQQIYLSGKERLKGP